MTKEQYAEYLQTNHWKELRRRRLEASRYKCDKCGSAFYLQVHHVRYRNIYDVELCDLRTVCRYCHECEHGIVSVHRPIRPNTKQLLRGVFNVPKKSFGPIFKPKRHTQAEIREIIKANKVNAQEITQRLNKENQSWKANQSNRQK